MSYFKITIKAFCVLLLGVLIFATFFIYFILNVKDNVFDIRKNNIKDFKSLKNDITKFAGKQFALVAALFLILISLGYLINAWNLVYSSRGIVFGASYTDTKVSLNFY